MTIDALAHKLEVLLTGNSLAATQLTKRERDRLLSLFEIGALVEERSGGGKKIIMKNPEALHSFISHNYPSGLKGKTFEEIGPRGKAVAEFRDSKKAREPLPSTILLRGYDNCELRSGKGVLPVAELTELAGVASLFLGSKEWSWAGKLAVIENLEVFYNFEKLGVGAEMALYAQGRLSDSVIQWLGSPMMEQVHIIHCGDYDPVGLDEYLRLKVACPERVTIFLPSDLETLFSKYGKRSLLDDKNSVILARLRKSEDQDVINVVKLMDIFGVGLEQEILLLAS